jgi:hypothetical protein
MLKFILIVYLSLSGSHAGAANGGQYDSLGDCTDAGTAFVNSAKGHMPYDGGPARYTCFAAKVSPSG